MLACRVVCCLHQSEGHIGCLSRTNQTVALGYVSCTYWIATLGYVSRTNHITEFGHHGFL